MCTLNILNKGKYENYTLNTLNKKVYIEKKPVLVDINEISMK